MSNVDYSFWMFGYEGKERDNLQFLYDSLALSGHPSSNMAPRSGTWTSHAWFVLALAWHPMSMLPMITLAF